MLPICTRSWHAEARVPYLHCADGTFISYDDLESWDHKLRYIQNMGLGGAMTWELAGDSEDHEMIQLMFDRMQ
jgi:chitinase